MTKEYQLLKGPGRAEKEE